MVYVIIAKIFFPLHVFHMILIVVRMFEKRINSSVDYYTLSFQEKTFMVFAFT